METIFQFRAAAPNDIDTLVDLMMISSWGGIRNAWERVRSPDETWRERGVSELSDVACEIGYSRFVVAEAEGRIAGMILLNILGDTSMLDPEAEPPEQAGVLRLIKMAEHSVFVREIAVVEWARGKGLGSAFLDLTVNIAESRRDPRVTLIVNDHNHGAHRLYSSRGFHQVAQAPCVDHPAFPDRSSLLLMEKPVPRTVGLNS